MNTRKLLFISKLAIVLLLVYTGGSTLLVDRNHGEVFAPASAGGGESREPPQADASGSNGSEDFSAIVERGIFGTAVEPSAQSNAGSLLSVDKELGIELVGTVAGAPAISRAIIKNTTTKSLGLYRTGQAVAGATIESIELNAVVLLHNGNRKKLSLKAAQTRSWADSFKPAQGKVKAVETAPYLPANRAGLQSVERPASRIGYIEQILSKAAIEPYAVNGKVEGLKITGIENVPAAELLGLQNGDIIRLVNGQQLTGLQKAFQILQKAKTQPTISLELSRGSETKELTFDLH